MGIIDETAFHGRVLFHSLPYRWHAVKVKALEWRHPGCMGKIRKSDVQPIFIVGAGRSGSTLLARLLHERGGVHFGPENFTLCETYLTYLRLLGTPWEERVRAILDLLVTQEEAWRWKGVDIRAVREYLLASEEHTLGNIIHAWYSYYGRAIGHPSDRWGCKTPNLTPFIGCFLEVFPRAKVIHLVRNPADVVTSFAHTDIPRYSKPRQAEVLWYFYHSLLHRRFGDRSILVRYEVLARDTESTLTRVERFLGISRGKECMVPYANPDTKKKHLRNVGGVVRLHRYRERVRIPPPLRELYREILAR